MTPWGDLIATPERGTFMGNRGVLHDAGRRIRRPWQVKRWIVCVLEFRGRHRTVMKPGHYTELFFLDEATALAAGHRPCFECRRQRFRDFCTAWQIGNQIEHSEQITAGAIDDRLHTERLGPDRTKRLHSARLEELPDGVFVRQEAWGPDPYLLWNGQLLTWTPAGYTNRRKRPRRAEVEVLTPASTVRAIQAGYIPAVHPSA